jgi:outer membrane protein
MKKLVSFVVIALMAFCSQTFAQAPTKLGHIESQAIISALPETTKAQETLKAEAKTLQDQMETMQVEFNKKYQEYLAKADSLPELVRKTKEEELNGLQTRIQAFQQNAQKSLQEKESALFKPIMEKVQKAIKEVGDENGFLYIFEQAQFLYMSPKGEDIGPLVKKKLGLDVIKK